MHKVMTSSILGVDETGVPAHRLALDEYSTTARATLVEVSYTVFPQANIRVGQTSKP
jgi:hypothetical protein